ncbi:MAG: hypothetical protein HRU28_16230 [Rhizobiales bacterium]|nr:hypothetical protein [Hyphomicrobiales bacterium]
MTNYIFAFHGGNKPKTAEDSKAIMAKWGVWMKGLGGAIVQAGAPISHSNTVTASGKVTDNGGSNPLSGFTIVQANNMAAAVKMANDCPILDNQGTVEVAEMITQ